MGASRTVSCWVTEAPGRQRTQAEQHERTHAVGHQRFPVGKAEFDSDRSHRGRENEQEHVVERVRNIE